tara:strand:- start:2106 stop:2915 length:810 start_codon:yes stop_codon:yes gene_type:complete
MRKPFVSILINNFNKENFCEKAVKSAFDQDYNKIEVIFYDDDSSDLSLNKIDFLKKKKKYKKLKVIKNKSRGLTSSYNQIKGIKRSLKKSKGQIICLLDSDDWFKKNKIKEVVNFFNKNKNQEILFDKPVFFFESGETKKVNTLYKSRKNKWPKFPPTSCISFRKKNLDSIISKVFNNDYPDLWIDFRLASFFAIKKKQFNLLNNHLTFYRQSEASFDKRYNKFLNVAWWRRRNQAFDFINQIDKKNSKNYQTFDYYLTRAINQLFSIF